MGLVVGPEAEDMGLYLLPEGKDMSRFVAVDSKVEAEQGCIPWEAVDEQFAVW